MTFVLAAAPPPFAGATCWFVFQNAKLLVHQESGDVPRAADPAALGVAPARSLFVGLLDGEPVFAAQAERDAPAPPHMAWEGLRALFMRWDASRMAAASRAVQLVGWDRDHRYCGGCAAPTVRRAGECARECPACGLVAYPRIAPAMMALVTRGRQLLLARAPRFPPGMYSALAGFVEAGESIEDCLVREVREEVGIEVTSLRYFGSQSWPFPNSLMIAFVCEYAGGELTPQAGEIEEAGWFDAGALPDIPPEISIAGRLIRAVAAELQQLPAAGSP